jgi:hypothetical protein
MCSLRAAGSAAPRTSTTLVVRIRSKASGTLRSDGAVVEYDVTDVFTPC